MDNITIIVEDYPQEITVQVEDYPQEITVEVTTTGITVNQENQIVANTQKVSDINHVALELFNVNNTSDLDKPISNITNQLLNAETQSRIDADNLLQSDIDNLDARIALNDAKVGITPNQISDIEANNLKVGITSIQANNILANNDKISITTQQANDIISNNAKVGITPTQTTAISDNESSINTINSTAEFISNKGQANGYVPLDANGKILELYLPSSVADVKTVFGRVGDVLANEADYNSFYPTLTDLPSLVSNNSAVALNTLKTSITTQQANDIIANNNKVGITVQQTSDIIDNNNKVGITSSQADAIVNNTSKVGITSVQANDIIANNSKVGYTDTLVSANYKYTI